MSARAPSLEGDPQQTYTHQSWFFFFCSPVLNQFGNQNRSQKDGGKILVGGQGAPALREP